MYLVYRQGLVTGQSGYAGHGQNYYPGHREVIYALCEEEFEAKLVKDRIEKIKKFTVTILHMPIYNASYRAFYTEDLEKLMEKEEFFGRTKEEMKCESAWKEWVASREGEK